jgi:putative hydrolase of the HAD superfamily
VLLRVRASGLRVGVLTNGDLEQQTAKVTRTGRAGHCGPVFASSALPAAKPDRRAFAEACRRLERVGTLADLLRCGPHG